MIRSITLENFFSFKDPVMIELSNINVLLGVNGSGKSNFMMAISMFIEANSNGVGLNLTKYGGTENIIHHTKMRSKLTFELDACTLNECAEAQLFNSNPIYEIIIGNDNYSVRFIKDGKLIGGLLHFEALRRMVKKLTCIREPENGMHFDLFTEITDKIKVQAKTSQLFIRTYSPLFVNYFELDDIIVFERLDRHTTARRIDFDQFKDWDEELLAGRMWVRGQLGGKIW